jgi:hypothetical protein
MIVGGNPSRGCIYMSGKGAQQDAKRIMMRLEVMKEEREKRLFLAVDSTLKLYIQTNPKVDWTRVLMDKLALSLRKTLVLQLQQLYSVSPFGTLTLGDRSRASLRDLTLGSLHIQKLHLHQLSLVCQKISFSNYPTCRKNTTTKIT